MTDNDSGFGFAVALVLVLLLMLLVFGHAGTQVSDSFNTYSVCVGFCR